MDCGIRAFGLVPRFQLVYQKTAQHARPPPSGLRQLGRQSVGAINRGGGRVCRLAGRQPRTRFTLRKAGPPGIIAARCPGSV